MWALAAADQARHLAAGDAEIAQNPRGLAGIEPQRLHPVGDGAEARIDIHEAQRLGREAELAQRGGGGGVGLGQPGVQALDLIGQRLDRHTGLAGGQPRGGPPLERAVHPARGLGDLVDLGRRPHCRNGEGGGGGRGRGEGGRHRGDQPPRAGEGRGEPARLRLGELQPALELGAVEPQMRHQATGEAVHRALPTPRAEKAMIMVTSAVNGAFPERRTPPCRGRGRDGAMPGASDQDTRRATGLISRDSADMPLGVMRTCSVIFSEPSARSTVVILCSRRPWLHLI